MADRMIQLGGWPLLSISGAGAIVLLGALAFWLLKSPLDLSQSMFRFDPDGGWWFLYLGRNLSQLVAPRLKIVTVCPSAINASTTAGPRKSVPPKTRTFFGGRANALDVPASKSPRDDAAEVRINRLRFITGCNYALDTSTSEPLNLLFSFPVRRRPSKGGSAFQFFPPNSSTSSKGVR